MLWGPLSANPFRASMPTEARMSAVHRLFDALNAEDAPRGVDATRSVLTVGREEAEREIRAGLAAFPEPTFSIQQCLVDPPRVSVFWTLDAAHEGAFLDIPPTGQSVHVSGTGLFTVRDGQIVRAVHLWDLAGFLRSIKLLPDLPRCPPASGHRCLKQ